MRLWSIHPKYLDRQGLLAVWREALLAKHVVRGLTKGYVRHPQLQRFGGSAGLINHYLLGIHVESVRRGYVFSRGKIGPVDDAELEVSIGQLAYEFEHLLKKLAVRDGERFSELSGVAEAAIEPHPMFRKVAGGVESWERIAGKAAVRPRRKSVRA